MCLIGFRTFTNGCEGSYDRKFFEQEALGEYLNVQAGVVYEGFQRNRNVRDVEIDGALPLFWALDFNVDPMSSIVAQKSGEEIRVLDEVVLSRASTLQACEEFHATVSKPSSGHCDLRGCVRAAAADSWNDGLSDHQGVFSTDGVPEPEISSAAE